MYFRRYAPQIVTMSGYQWIAYSDREDDWISSKGMFGECGEFTSIVIAQASFFVEDA